MDLSAVTALILAGGLGTRLRSIAPVGPKALTPVMGRPFLEYQIEWLQRQGIRRIVLCLGYANQAIIDHVDDRRRFGVDVTYSVEPEPLGTAGALALAGAEIAGTVLAMNGDTYYLDDLAPMLAQHLATGAQLTIAAGTAGERGASGQVVADAALRVTRFAEKSDTLQAAWISAGLYLIEPAVLQAIPSGRAVSLERETIPALVAENAPVFVYPLRRGFWDMGTPEGHARLAKRLAGWLVAGDE